MKKLKKQRIISFSIVLLLFSIFTTNVYAAHTHTDSCYESISHSHIGNSTSGGACYSTPIYHTHTDECYRSSCELGTPTLSSLPSSDSSFSCSNPNCFIGTGQIITTNNVVVFTCTCNVCGASTTYKKCAGCDTLISGDKYIPHTNPSREVVCGMDGQVIYYKLSCTLPEGNTNGNLICNQIVVSIEPVNGLQYSSLDTSVIATYRDGHTQIVKANSDYNSGKTYNGELITLTLGDASCFVTFYSKTQNQSSINIDVTKDNKIDLNIGGDSYLDTIISENTHIEEANTELVTDIVISENDKPYLKEDIDTNNNKTNTNNSDNTNENDNLDLPSFNPNDIDSFQGDNEVNETNNNVSFIGIIIIGVLAMVSLSVVLIFKKKIK